MSAKPHLGVDNNFDKCPLCKGDPKHCPHSLSQMAERLWENWCRKIVRDEIYRMGLLNG